MARPKKKGLDYFPFDVDFFDDEKIEAISGEFGLKGELAVIKLLCSIYRNGYYTQWNEQLRLKLCRRLPGVSPELMEKIVQKLVLWDFFDRDLFHSSAVLTSSGIQNRYLEATRRRSGSAISDYACINGVSVDRNPFNEGINVCNNPQSKVKESKGYLCNSSEPSNTVTTTEPDEIPKKIGQGGKYYVLVIPPTLGSQKYRVEGETGLQEFFEMNRSILNQPEFAKKFLMTNNGKHYNDFKHVFNDYKNFVTRQFK